MTDDGTEPGTPSNDLTFRQKEEEQEQRRTTTPLQQQTTAPVSEREGRIAGYATVEAAGGRG